ncbi:MAG: hypothetical protein RL559_1185 [Pseudomonadota bacterium]
MADLPPHPTPVHNGTGLSQREAAERLANDGPNALDTEPARGPWQRARDLLREPMFALLLLAALLYIALGDLTEGLTLAVFVLAVLVLTFYQEGRAQASLQALRQLTQAQARVWRDGQVQRIAAREVVVGDLLLLAEGDRIAADARVLQAENLMVDESLLTGESLPVGKQAGPDEAQASAPGAADSPSVFAATHVVRGQALARVTATGARTEVGRIGQALAHTPQPSTPLQRQTAVLVRQLAWAVAALSVLMVLTLGLRHGDWVAALLAGIALAMAALPEEYPVVLALFPALGARRLTREGVLARRINAIETLGAVSVLCTDKTGTLTQNRMTVSALATGPANAPQVLQWPGQNVPVVGDLFHPLLEHAILASAPEPFDPMEHAFHRMGSEHLPDTEHLHPDWTLVHSYPLSPALPAMTQVWRPRDAEGPEARHSVSVKGAPEAVMDLCHLGTEDRRRWLAVVERMAADGLRVLAVARGQADGQALPDSAHALDFEWLGLVGLTDPLRPNIQDAVAQCRQAGIRIVMITGDYPATARVIARQAGLPDGEVLTGAELQQLDDAALQARLPRVSVCARITPTQKLRLVQALQAQGEVVAMTGDGVNDAPALRAAHVGIAMGLRGTDVAREAAALVLVDDRFGAIVRGIGTGRRIFDNLRQSMRYIFAIHIPIVLLALWPLLGGPSLLLPIHLALLELVIDPACAIAFENQPAAANTMRRPPRDTRQALFGARDVGHALAQGLALSAAIALALGWALHSGGWTLASPEVRSLTLATLVLGNAVLVLWRPGALRLANPVAWALSLAAVAVLAALMHLPWSAQALRLAALPALGWAVAAGCSLLAVAGVTVLTQRVFIMGR